jgi:hypothetical protein
VKKYITDQKADTQRVVAQMVKDSTLLAQAEGAITAWVRSRQAGGRAGDICVRHSTARAHGKQR